MIVKSCITSLLLLALVAASLPAEQVEKKAIEQSQTQQYLLWQENLTPPTAYEGNEKLARASALLEKIQLPAKKQAKAKSPTTQPAAATDNEAAEDADEAPPGKLKLPAKVLAQLKTAVPTDVLDKVSLGDALFKTAHLAEAFSVYQHALGETEDEDEQAWLLFQMANCKFDSDPARASELYEQLLAKQPEGAWSAPAKLQKDLIAWRDQHKPTELLKNAEDEGRVSQR